MSSFKNKKLYKKLYIYLIVLLKVTVSLASSRQQYPNPQQLELGWQVYENHYLGKDQTLSGISLRNTGTVAFPATGWKIYFNFGKKMVPLTDSDNLNISHVNGGLFVFSPGKAFKGLAGGQQIEQKYISNSWVVNSSDAPQGFYLVWDNAPGKGILLNAPKITAPADPHKLERFTGDTELSQQQLFTQNEIGRNQAGNTAGRIFPRPLSYQETPGYYTLHQSGVICTAQQFAAEARLLSDDLKSLLGTKLKISYAASQATRSITLKMDTSLKPDEYRLSVSPRGILISGRGAREIHYGIQSLKVLLDPAVHKISPVQKTLQVKCVEVQDRPLFGFRGIMLDVARNFQSKQEVLKLIDLLSLYKFTTLHLHLNDDEGWRIQIKALPELTDVGSKRGHTLNEQERLMPSYGSGPAEDVNSGSGFYYRQDFIEILKYAAERHINVIPEIETPGHARAAIVSMRARYNKFIKLGDTIKAREYLLRDAGDSSVYRSVQQWNDHVMDVSMPSVYHFLETVSDELIGMYQQAGAPLETIHFGGDEVPAGVWTGSPSVNVFKVSHPDIKEPADLWNYFFSHLSGMLHKKGLYLSGWEETALQKSTGGTKRWQPNPLFLDKNFHVNVWNNMAGNEDLAYRLANSGYKVILSFVTNFYFDMAYIRQFDEQGFNWGGLINLEQSYKFIPFNYLQNQHTDYINKPLPQSMLKAFEPLTPEGQKNIIGLQGLLWTETVKTPERLEYMYLPRMLALAERAWSPQPAWAATQDTLKARVAYEKDWAGFTSAVSREMKRLDHYSGGYQYRIPTPAALSKNNRVAVNTDLPGFQLRYTTDGSAPDTKSKIYHQPVPLVKNLRFRAFNTVGRGGTIITLSDGQPVD